jgi:zinc transporter ZupT
MSEVATTPVADRWSAPTWLKGIGPLVLLAVLVATFLRVGPVGVFQKAFPPVEELTIDRITMPATNLLVIRVVNGGPAPVTVAQVLVDDAVWTHSIDGDRTIGRLESREITVPYPWVEGEPVGVELVTSTGLTFAGGADVATLTPTPDARYLGTFAMLGVYVGVIPVFLGILWLPFLRSIRKHWLDFFLSLTVGLLVFLGADALVEALEIAGRVPGAFQGFSIVLFGVVGTPLVINALGQSGKRGGGPDSALRVSTLIAFAIGLHNLGEGLAIGAAYATGAIALGTFLVLGFLIHNTTEGLGIVAPLAGGRPGVGRLALLGLLAGGPTILGAWIGGFTYSPVWSTLFFAVGAGAVIQVVFVLARRFVKGPGFLTPLNTAGLLLGLVIMYTTGLLVAA